MQVFFSVSLIFFPFFDLLHSLFEMRGKKQQPSAANTCMMRVLSILFVCSSHSSNIFVWPKIMLSIRIRQEERNKLKNRKKSKNKFFADFLFENKSNKRTSVVCTQFIDYFLDWFRGAVVIATFPFQSSSFTVSSFLFLSLSHLNHVHRLLLSSHIANER